MAVTKGSFICHALRKTISSLSRQRNMPILFTFVSRTILRAQSHLGKSFRAGLNMRVHTKRFCSLTLPTRRTFRSRKFRVRFSQFFQERRFHWSALRIYGYAKVASRADGKRPAIVSLSTLAPTLEHK